MYALRGHCAALCLAACFATALSCFGGDGSARGPPSTVIHELLGPLPPDPISRLVSENQQPITSASQLSCDFDVPYTCCWHNVHSGVDDVDFVLLTGQPSAERSRLVFNTLQTPVVPFAAVSAWQSESLTYGFLTSCPIACTKGRSELTFDHWSSPGVTVDVCTLPLGEAEFDSCHEVPAVPGTSRRSVTIDQVDRPFTIVIVASSFTAPPGGIAAVDTIRFAGDVCDELDGNALDRGGRNLIPKAPAAAGVGANERPIAICAALPCSWMDASGAGTLCHWRPLHRTLDAPLSAAAVPMQPQIGRTGNYAAGVVRSPHGSGLAGGTYIGGRVNPRSVLAVKSGPFASDNTVTIAFDYYEQAQGVQLRLCYDGVSSESPHCVDVSRRGTHIKDRQWRSAVLDIPPAPHTRVIYLIADNTGYNYGAVGIGPIKVVAGASCDNQSDLEFTSLLL